MFRLLLSLFPFSPPRLTLMLSPCIASFHLSDHKATYEASHSSTLPLPPMQQEQAAVEGYDGIWGV
jgi:hypothetical protein